MLSVIDENHNTCALANGYHASSPLDLHPLPYKGVQVLQQGNLGQQRQHYWHLEERTLGQIHWGEQMLVQN